MAQSYKIQESVSTGTDSALQRYMDLVLGQRSMLKLIRYEFITLLCAWMPGAAGIWLRGKLYPWLMGSVGKNVIFGCSVTLRHPHKIHVGSGVIFDDNVLLDAKGSGNAGIEIGDGSFIGRNSIISCKDGEIFLGKNTNIGFNCILACTNSIRLGDDNIIAAYTYIIGGGNYKVDGIDVPMAQAYDYDGKGGVELKNDVWLGAHVSVLDGVTIEDGCVVSAGAVVTKSLPSRSISMGTPAKPVRYRDDAPAPSAEL